MYNRQPMKEKKRDSNMTANGEFGSNPFAQNLNYCVLCKKTCNLFCERCGDPYCCAECQTTDWSKHRYICFPKPRLVPASMISATPAYNNDRPSLKNANLKSSTTSENTNQKMGNRRSYDDEGREKSGNRRSLDDDALTRASNKTTNDGQSKSGNRSSHEGQGKSGNRNTNEGQGKSGNRNSNDGQNKSGTRNSNEGQSKSANKNAASNEQKIIHSQFSINLPTLPKEGARVKLLGCRPTNRCYIRIIAQKENEEFISYMNTLKEYGKTAMPLQKMPQSNSYAICSLDGDFCRVQILGANNENSIKVLFCDTGLMETRPLSDLREITDDILRLKQQSSIIKLRDVSLTYDNDQMRFLSKYINKELLVNYGPRDDRGAIGELHCPDTNVCLNEKMVEATSAKFDSSHDFDSRKTNIREKEKSLPNYKAKQEDEDWDVAGASSDVPSKSEKLPDQAKKNVRPKRDETPEREGNQAPPKREATPERECKQASPERDATERPFKLHLFKENARNISVIVLDNSFLKMGYFGCIAEKDLPRLAVVQAHLQKMTGSKPYKPRLFEYCVAKFDDEWYRAKVTERINETKYVVLYVDFGNESTVSYEDIRRYPEDLDEDCYTNSCMIGGLPEPVDGKLLAFLENQLEPQSKFVIEKVEACDDDLTAVDCEGLLNKARAQQLM